jgi:glycosyltransferase involved in cell wall biosynthesis
VVDGITGLVIDEPSNVAKVARPIDALLSDTSKLRAMGVASRERALAEFDYNVLTARLAAVLKVDA